MSYKSQINIFPDSNLLDIYPIQFGHAVCPPSHSYGPVSKKDFLFHYIVEGTGEVSDEHHRDPIRISKGEGFIIFPDTIASYRANENDPWEYYWIEFNGFKSLNYLRLAGLDPARIHYFPEQTMSVNQDIVEPLKEIIINNGKFEPFILMNTYRFFNALIEGVAKSNAANHYTHRRKVQSGYIANAIHFIELHYAKPISVTDIADYLGIHPQHLTRLFKQELDTPPSQYLIQYRLKEAQNLLDGTNLTISEIAQKVGYSNQFYFSNVFKQHYGISPKNYRYRSIHS